MGFSPNSIFPATHLLLFRFHLQHTEAVLDAAFDDPDSAHVHKAVSQVVADIRLVALGLLDLHGVFQAAAGRVVLERPQAQVVVAEEAGAVWQKLGATEKADAALLDTWLGGVLAAESLDDVIGAKPRSRG